MRTEKEKMIAGEPYLAGDKTLTQERLHCKQLLYELNIKEYIMSEKGKAILARLIPNAPKSLYIEPPFFCDYRVQHLLRRERLL
jgi:maltose O-acetyltransferase